MRTYEVQFDDGTICGDLSASDIMVSLADVYMNTSHQSTCCHLSVPGRASAWLCSAGTVEQETAVQWPHHWILLCTSVHGKRLSL